MSTQSPTCSSDTLPSDYFPAANTQTDMDGRKRKIVIAYDHSENSDATFAKCIRLGLIGPEDEIYIVHVNEQKDIQHIFTPISQHTKADRTVFSCASRAASSVTEGFLIEIKKLLVTNGFKHVTTEVVLGDSKQSLVDYCLACKPDILICSSRGFGQMRKVILGSTSSFLIKNAPCPVLVCKLSDKELEERKKYECVKKHHFEHLLGAIKEKYN